MVVYQPRTAKLMVGVEYMFQTSHCGLLRTVHEVSSGGIRPWSQVEDFWSCSAYFNMRLSCASSIQDAHAVPHILHSVRRIRC